jgi:hypothetical protein
MKIETKNLAFIDYYDKDFNILKNEEIKEEEIVDEEEKKENIEETNERKEKKLKKKFSIFKKKEEIESKKLIVLKSKEIEKVDDLCFISLSFLDSNSKSNIITLIFDNMKQKNECKDEFSKIFQINLKMK